MTTGDAAIDAVLSRLEAASASTFGADYDLLTRFGDLRTTATVAQDGSARRSVTIGDVRFLTDGATTATCDLDADDVLGHDRRGADQRHAADARLLRHQRGGPPPS